jgi:preprotein translocase subunit SecA
MAGRGVDILLGGPDGSGYQAVADSGGLCVLGTERSEPRIEAHLRGRAGRQEDPGESKFFISAQDQIVSPVLRRMPASWLPDGVPFPRLSAMIDKSQATWAAQVAASLARQVAFDDVVGEQQRLIYGDRWIVLAGHGLQARVAQMLGEVVSGEVAQATGAGETAEQLLRRLKRLYPTLLQPDGLVAMYRGGTAKDKTLHVIPIVLADAEHALTRRKAQVGRTAIMREFERRVLLSVTDRAWQDHLVAVHDMLTGLTIRATGGAIALPEYQRAAARLFADMTDAARADAIIGIFSIKLQLDEQKA